MLVSFSVIDLMSVHVYQCDLFWPSKDPRTIHYFVQLYGDQLSSGS